MSDAYVREMTVQREGQVLLEGLPIRAGERIEVVIIRRASDDPTEERYRLHGKPLIYDRPLDPAVDPDDWEANR